jgi:hypothetical protein
MQDRLANWTGGDHDSLSQDCERLSMPIRNCVGDDRKWKIVSRYDIEPGPHCKMLPTQENDGTRQECCQKPLKREFYQFFYTPKPGAKFTKEFPEESGSFFVGIGCGPTFIKILQERVDPNIVAPKLFDPLDPPPRPRRERTRNPDPRGRPAPDGLPLGPTSVNFELMTVIQLIATICPTPIAGNLCTVLNWLRKHPTIDTYDFSISAVNRAIQYHPEFNGRTLRQAMDDEATLGVRWRNFSFSYLERILRDREEPSFIDPTANIPDVPPLRRWATVIRSVDGGYRVRVDNEPTEDYALLMERRCGDDFAPHAPLNCGDRLLVRLGEHPDRPSVVRVYEVAERARFGSIRYIGPNNSYAFAAMEDDGPNVHIAGQLFAELGCGAQRGARLALRTRETHQNPEATWVQIVDPDPNRG